MPAGDVAAFYNLTVVAGGAVTVTGLLQSRLATNVSGSDLSLGAITAGTDMDLTATAGAIGATGALTAGTDATIDAATNIAVPDPQAGDDPHPGTGATRIPGSATRWGTGVTEAGVARPLEPTAGRAGAPTATQP